MNTTNYHRAHICAVYVPATVGYALSFGPSSTTLPQPLEIVPTGDPVVRCLTCDTNLHNVTAEPTDAGTYVLIWQDDQPDTEGGVNLTVNDWQLYTATYGDTPEMAEATQALNTAASEALMLTRDAALSHFTETAIRYARLGAADTEPRTVFLDLWDAVHTR